VTGHPSSAGSAVDSQRSWASVYSIPPGDERVRAGGVEVSVSQWEGRCQSAGPDVLLVHGGAAQRQWWDHIAPLLQGAGRVVALDLSGHGDSQHRDLYSLDDWSGEVLDVAEVLCGTEPPMLVGHSMGGLVAVNAAQQEPESFAAVLALDSPLRRSAQSYGERRRKIASRPVRSFGSEDEALKGYKTFPPVADAPPEVMAHIARAAFRRADDRWALKYDPRVYLRPQVADDFVRLAQIPTWWVRAEHGFIDDSMAQRLRESLGPAGSLLQVPGAGHHLLLEQPLATAWVINLFIQQPPRVNA
jgi:pimeloyl-ACP methyl ester carboxylesterase